MLSYKAQHISFMLRTKTTSLTLRTGDRERAARLRLLFLEDKFISLKEKLQGRQAVTCSSFSEELDGEER